MIRSQHYTPQAPDGGVTGSWWARVLAHVENPDEWTIALNEPNFANQDALQATDAARMLREDFVERIVVYDPRREQGQPARVLPVKWVGLNVMAGLDSSRRWLRDYQAAGGPEPYRHGCHCYPTTGNGLRAQVAEWRAFLATLGWRNPLVVTEVGPRPVPVGTPPGNPDDVIDVLRAAFALWNEGAIDGFAWFSSRYDADEGVWSAGDLMHADGTLTALGNEYRKLSGGPPGPPVNIKTNLWFPVARR